MNLDSKGRRSLPTFTGICISLMLVIGLAMFALYRTVSVFKRDGWQMLSTVKENFFAQDEMFGLEQGFNFAIALWEPLDPKIGELAIYSDEWGHDEVTGEDYWQVR